MRGASVAGGLLMLACVGSAGGTATSAGRDASSTPEAAQAPDTAEAAGGPDALEFIVGSQRGVEAWRADGAGRRLLSAGPALHPRWLSPELVLVLAPRSGDGLQGGATFELVELESGRREHVAELPPFACANAKERGREAPLHLYLHAEDDFHLGAAERTACLTLMDRNLNMASVVLRVRVDLQKATVERVLALGADECAPPPGVDSARDDTARDDTSCAAGAPSAAPPPAAIQAEFPFAFGESHVVYSAQEELLLVPGYAPESLSPSGRWLLLAGDESEGDYMHRSLVLLDRAAGAIYPIASGRTSWPEPIAVADGSTRSLAVPIAGTVDVVAESDVRWLGDSESSELLVIDDLAVKPGVAMFAVSGDVAR